MRIAHLLATLIAVLAAVVLPRCGAQDYNNSYSLRRSVRSLPPSPNNIWDAKDSESQRSRGWQRAREMQAIVRRESDNGGSVDCCPSVLEMVEPTGGKNHQDMFVELYRDGEHRQRFYELSCRKDVENKPCRFVQRELYNQSRCVQKFSYTYALVRDVGGEHQRHQRHFPALQNGGWTLDYIQIRSGCACELRPKGHHRRHRPTQRRRPHDRDT